MNDGLLPVQALENTKGLKILVSFTSLQLGSAAIRRFNERQIGNSLMSSGTPAEIRRGYENKAAHSTSADMHVFPVLFTERHPQWQAKEPF